MKINKLSLPIILLRFLILVLGISALIGGTLLLIKPDGSLLGMNTDYLLNTPFNNFTIPGLLLLSVLGIIAIISFIGLLQKNTMKWPEKLNIYKNMHWAWAFTFYTGIITLIWIAVQILTTSYFWLQPVILSIALIILIVAMLPPVVKRYEKTNLFYPKD